VRRPGHRRCFQRLLLEREEPLGQSVELGADLLDDLPLFGELIGQLLDRLRLMCDDFLKLGDTARFVGHRVLLAATGNFPALSKSEIDRKVNRFESGDRDSQK